MRKKEQLDVYLRMGAARCYFTGADSNFVLEGARGFLAEAKGADAAFAG